MSQEREGVVGFDRDPFVVLEKFMGPLEGASDEFRFACSHKVHPIRAIIAERAEFSALVEEVEEERIMLQRCKKDRRGQDILQ